jgi:hypothetical protein
MGIFGDGCLKLDGSADVTEGRGVGATTAPLYWICSDADFMVDRRTLWLESL